MKKTIVLMLALISTSWVVWGQVFEAKLPRKVLKHVVMYQFKNDATPEQVQAVVKTFSELPGKINTIKGFEHGVNVSKEGKSEGMTHVFVVTFQNQNGLEEYLKHPAHDHYVSVVKNHREKVIVFDYWADVQ